MSRTASAIRRLAGGSFLLVLAAACAEPTTLVAPTAGASLAASAGGKAARWKSAARFIHGRVLFVAPGGALFAGDEESSLFRSTDDGLTWTAVAGYPDAVGVLAIAAGEKGELYVGSTNGVYRSADGGTWESLGLDGLYITAIGRTVRGSVFAAAMGRDGGVFRYDIAEDGSASWTQVFPAINPREFIPTYLAIAPTADLVLGTRVDGEWLTRSGGAEWEYLHYAGAPEFLPPITDMEFTADGTMIAAWNDGILRSLDGGMNWLPALGGVQIQHLVTAPDGSLYAASILGSVYRSLDGGRSWTVTIDAKKPMELRDFGVTARGTLLASGWEGIWTSEK